MSRSVAGPVTETSTNRVRSTGFLGAIKLHTDPVRFALLPMMARKEQSWSTTSELTREALEFESKYKVDPEVAKNLDEPEAEILA